MNSTSYDLKELARVRVKVLADNRITIPREICKAWNLEKGESIWVVVERPKKEVSTR